MAKSPENRFSYSVTATNGWSSPSGRIALLSGLVHFGITPPRLIG
jgi:hypothetical protein